jgi:hypothetical protein
VPRGDCSPSSGELARRDHHPAGRVTEDRHDFERERATKAEPRLDGRADDDELGAMIVRDLRQLAAERSLPRPDDPAAGADAVRLRDRRGMAERGAQSGDLRIEVRVEGQLLRDEERRDEDDARAAVGGEPAREVERVDGLGAPEERHHDRPVADGGRAAGEALRATADGADVRPAHQSSW